jgi:hypothetical protein
MQYVCVCHDTGRWISGNITLQCAAHSYFKDHIIKLNLFLFNLNSSTDSLKGNRVTVAPDHDTRTHTHSLSLCIVLPWIRDRPVAETCNWKHTTLTRDRHPYYRRDSNLQSQKACGCRPTPETARPLESAKLVLCHGKYEIFLHVIWPYNVTYISVTVLRIIVYTNYIYMNTNIHTHTHTHIYAYIWNCLLLCFSNLYIQE